MQQFTRAGLTFDVRDEGPVSGEPVVLLHGFPQSAECWDGVAPLLHRAGIRTLAPDQRGYSPAARPSGRRAYRVSECAQDVIALLDQAGLESAHVVGHDWGGAVAWQLGAVHPQRVRTLTVVSTPHPAALAKAIARGPQALKSSYIAFFQLPVLPELLLPRALVGSLRRSGLPPETARDYAARITEPGALSAALNWYRAIPFGAGEAVGRCRVPTTYVWGRKDIALGRQAAEATRSYVSAPYRFVDLDAGHWLPETRPALVADLILDRVRAPLPQ